jgi:hypothetical protein
MLPREYRTIIYLYYALLLNYLTFVLSRLLEYISAVLHHIMHYNTKSLDIESKAHGSYRSWLHP